MSVPPNAGIFQESSFLGTQTFETSDVGGNGRGQDGTHHESLFVPGSNCLSGTPEQVEPVRKWVPVQLGNDCYQQ